MRGVASQIVGLAVAFLLCGEVMAVEPDETGLTQQTAIRISTTAADAQRTIQQAQIVWLSKTFPGAKADFSRSRYILSASVVQSVPVRLAGGKEVALFFDITPAGK